MPAHQIRVIGGPALATRQRRVPALVPPYNLSLTLFLERTTEEPAMHVINVRQLRKSYGEGPLQVHALRGLDLTVRQGEFLAIMGPSGSGKSTLLHLLGGIESPSSGQILLEGVNLAEMDDDARRCFADGGSDWFFSRSIFYRPSRPGKTWACPSCWTASARPN